MRAATCGDCIHAEICKQVNSGWFSAENIAYCKAFKDRNKYVEVVRCKDCKSWEQYNACDGTKPHRCMNHNAIFYKRTAPNDFCSYGERKDNGYCSHGEDKNEDLSL